MRDLCPACQAPLDVQSAALTVVACPHCSAPLLAAPGAASVSGVFASADASRPGAIQLPPEFGLKYKILRQLGAGAMGTVMLAVDLATGEQLAIKFLMRHDDPQQLKRFMREGKLMAAIQHPNVVRVFEIGEIGAHPFLACEYVTGGSLRDLVHGGKRVEMPRALDLMADAFTGLAVCHENEIVHRDLKPENILVDAKGHAKLADLGIARDTASHGGTLTKTGVLIGTPLYMSPEQIVGDRGSTASDIYSLGLVLYELVVGSNPMAAPTLQEVFRRQCDLEPRTFEDLGIEAPAGISALVAQLLSKAISERPQSAATVAGVLREAALRGRAGTGSGVHKLGRSGSGHKLSQSSSGVKIDRAGQSGSMKLAGASGRSATLKPAAPGAGSRASQALSRPGGSFAVGTPDEKGARLRLALLIATVFGALLAGILHFGRKADRGPVVVASATAAAARPDELTLPILDLRIRMLERALYVHCTTPRPARVRAAAVEEGSDGAVKASAATTVPAYVHRLVLENLRPSVSYRVQLDSLVGDPPVRFAPRPARTAAEGERAAALNSASIARDGNDMLVGQAGLHSAKSWSDVFPLRRWGELRDLPLVRDRMLASPDWEGWREGLTILRWIGAPEAAKDIARGLALLGPSDDPESKVREAVKALESAGGPEAAEALGSFMTGGLAEATPAQARWRDWLRVRAARALWRVDPARAAARFQELAQGADQAPLGLYAGALAELPWALDVAESALAAPAGITGERLLSAAVAGLARMGGARARAGLERALKRPDLPGWARGAAVDGLATWGGDEAVPLVIKEIEALAKAGPPAWMRHAAAARALAMCAHRAGPGPRKAAALALAGSLSAPEPVRRAAYRGLALLAEPDTAPALEAAWTARRGPAAELAFALASTRAAGAGAAIQALLSTAKATDLLFAALATARQPAAERQAARVRGAIAALASPFARERLGALMDALEADEHLLENPWLDVGAPWWPTTLALTPGDGVKLAYHGFTAYRAGSGAIPELEGSAERGVDLYAPEGRHAGVTELRIGGVNVRIGRQELAQPLYPDVTYSAQLPGDLHLRLMMDEFGEADDIELFHPVPIPWWQYTGLVIVKVARAR